MDLESRFTGLLLGTAAGDSLGLPGKGLAKQAYMRRFPGPLRQRLLFGRGMVGVSTELTVMAAQAALYSGGDLNDFRLTFAWKLKWWGLFRPVGIGWGRLRAILRLWRGVPPRWSGVNSAGNGAAVRSAVLGALLFDPVERSEFVFAATQVTHCNQRAYSGALAVAEMAALVMAVKGQPSVDEVVFRLRAVAAADPEWCTLIETMREGWHSKWSVGEFADRIGQGDGVDDSAYHTVTVALFGWLRHWGDVGATLTEVIHCGGDTDATGAIAGALAGLSAGAEAIPSEYLEHLADYPLTVGVLRKLGVQLTRFARCLPSSQVSIAHWAIPLRNVWFLMVILARRLANIRRAG